MIMQLPSGRFADITLWHDSECVRARKVSDARWVRRPMALLGDLMSRNPANYRIRTVQLGKHATETQLFERTPAEWRLVTDASSLYEQEHAEQHCHTRITSIHLLLTDPCDVPKEPLSMGEIEPMLQDDSPGRQMKNVDMAWTVAAESIANGVVAMHEMIVHAKFDTSRPFNRHLGRLAAIRQLFAQDNDRDKPLVSQDKTLPVEMDRSDRLLSKEDRVELFSIMCPFIMRGRKPRRTSQRRVRMLGSDKQLRSERAIEPAMAG